MEQQKSGRKLDATGTLHVPLTEFKNPKTSPMLIETPGDKISFPMENSFEDALKGEHAAGVTESERMEEAHSDPEEDMVTGENPAEEVVPGSYARIAPGFQ